MNKKIRIKKKYLKIAIPVLSFYLITCLFIFKNLFSKYSNPDLELIEPKNQVSNLRILYNRNKTGNYKTQFNKKYYATFNSFGSRNLFDIYPKVKNNSIILLGDSFIFGAGLNDNETVSYFLNDIDHKRRYINLALNNANIADSGEHFISKCDNFLFPKAVILQILWINDICDSITIQKKALHIIKSDFKYFPLPFRSIINQKIFLPFYLSHIYERIYKDLTPQRFKKYIIQPLDRITEKGENIIVISFGAFGHENIFSQYNEWLKNYCVKKGIYFYNIENLLEKKYFFSRISPEDNHPNAKFNKQLALKIKALLENEVLPD